MIVYQDFQHWAIVLPLATPLIYKLLRKKQHITNSEKKEHLNAFMLISFSS
jgi:hypothetical protein